VDVVEGQANTIAIPGWAARHRFTVDAYHRMGEAGILHPAERIELIDGEIIKMAPIGSPHIGAVLVLTQRLAQAAPPNVVVSVHNPIQMGDRSEPEPDLALLKARPDGYRKPPPPSAADVLFIIEVSDTRLRYDREVKLRLYASHGVPEVWIVDLAARAADIHRKPDKDTYAEVTRYGRGETLQPSGFPGLRIPVDEIV
jgi:Uma2 family endonuclease